MDTQLLGSIRIRPLVGSDATGLAAAYSRHRAHLQPWEPARSESFYTPAGQRDAVETSLAAQGEGKGHHWVLVDGADVVGRVSLDNVVRGAFLSCTMGYWVGEDHQGRGLMTAAVGWVCDVAADGLGLHRIQAGTLVTNVASQKVLERCSFTMIGLAPTYLRIDGRWQDHLLFQRILHD